jgi:hypothetical protein
MTAEPERTATGWTRLPRWQLVVLIVLSAVGLLAAIANVAAASSNRSRGLHAGFGLLVAALLFTLVTSLRRRRPPE